MADLDLELESGLEFMGLLCSRICHDLVSPVGAIANGIEILEEENDPKMREQAIALIEESARRASQKLQFLRLALGAGGERGSRMALDEAADAARTQFDGGRIAFEWNVPPLSVERRIGKLLLNLVLLGQDTLPRGGRLRAELAAEPSFVQIRLSAEGSGARLPEDFDLDAILARRFGGLSPRGAQICYTLLLAHSLGATVDSRTEPDRVEISVRVPGEG